MVRLIILALLIFTLGNAHAQQSNDFGNELTDIITRLQKRYPDQGVVTINQEPTIANLLDLHVLQNAKRPGMNGYRIRIYFDLGQKARQKSEEVMKTFMEKYPGIKVYQTYNTPYWKISVGDFRTHDSALKLYNSLLREYPKAFIVPEWINFPPLY
jgi:hypothetical protein